MVEHEIFLPQVAAHRSCQTDERTILVGSVFDSQSVPANRESPSQLVLVAEREEITTTWAVDQITRDFQPNQEFPHPRDVVSDFLREQGGI